MCSRLFKKDSRFKSLEHLNASKSINLLSTVFRRFELLWKKSIHFVNFLKLTLNLKWVWIAVKNFKIEPKIAQTSRYDHPFRYIQSCIKYKINTREHLHLPLRAIPIQHSQYPNHIAFIFSSTFMYLIKYFITLVRVIRWSMSMIYFHASIKLYHHIPWNDHKNL